MARKIPPHLPLDSEIPHGWDGKDRQLNVTLTYERSTEDSSTMIFKYIVEPKHYDEYLHSSDDLQFGISDDCTINFLLAEHIKWRWSKKYFTITSKKNYKKLYGDVKIINAKLFSIKSMYNRNIIDDIVHSFNLNIDYYQGDGKWLPITIDPDIGNPKPNLVVGQSGSFKSVPSGNVEEE